MRSFLDSAWARSGSQRLQVRDRLRTFRQDADTGIGPLGEETVEGRLTWIRPSWLLGQKVRRDDMRTALVSMIRTESAATLAPALESVGGRLSSAWQIGKALVERAAASP